MSHDQTNRAIRWHAGLEGDALDPESVSGAIAAGTGVDAAVASFIDCLQRLNLELNGLSPSVVVVDSPEAMLPAALVYAVADVARMLRRERYHEAAWAVDAAWLAVLAGDVDDVADHVAAERTARD